MNSGDVDLRHEQGGGIQTLHLLGWCMGEALDLFIQKAAVWEADGASAIKQLGVDPRSLLTEGPLQASSVRMDVSPPDAIVPTAGEALRAYSHTLLALANAEDSDPRVLTMREYTRRQHTCFADAAS